MIFGERLKKLLDEMEMKQCELSDRLHIAPSTLNGYINGNREPDYKILIKIADFFQVSTDYLLGMTNVWKNKDGEFDESEGALLGVYRILEPAEKELLLEHVQVYYRHSFKQREQKKKKK